MPIFLGDIMKLSNPFKDLKKFDIILWLTSVAVIIVSFALSGGSDIVNMITSVIGVTALIFVANGLVFGQALLILFALLYGLISLYFGYYGEMITYVFMSLPCAVIALFSWLKHPYKDTNRVTVNKLKAIHFIFVAIVSLVGAFIFYFILKALNTENLYISTFSVATSLFAATLTYLRSPYYAIGYAVNDIVLIILWVYASVSDISYLPMVACFVTFLANDSYGFYNWKKMQKMQNEN